MLESPEFSVLFFFLLLLASLFFSSVRSNVCENYIFSSNLCPINAAIIHSLKILKVHIMSSFVYLVLTCIIFKLF